MFALALEGGGAKGAAHVGVLRALLENGLIPSALAGTSSGSIVAGLYAWRGLISDAKRALDEWTRRGYFLLDIDLCGILRGAVELFFHMDFTLKGVIRGDRLEKWLAHATHGTMMADVKIPLFIPAVDLYSENLIVFAGQAGPKTPQITWMTGAPLSKAMRASSAIPIAFRPLYYQNTMLVDGGVLSNLPASSLLLSGHSKILSVCLDGIAEKKDAYNDFIGIGVRTIKVMENKFHQRETAVSAYVLSLPLPEEGTLFSFKSMPRYEKIGYDGAMAVMPELLRLFGPPKKGRA